MIEGSCLCQTVRYRINGEPVAFRYCHCSRCRKAKGTAHATNLFVKAEDFSWLSGEDNLGNYDLPAAERFGNAFCKTCGSPMPRRAEGSPTFNIPAGSLDADPGIRVDAQIYTGSRAPWFDVDERIPGHEESP